METLQQGPEEPDFGIPSATSRTERIHLVTRNPELEQKARQAGSVAGAIVAAVRSLRRKLQSSEGESTSDKIRVIAHRGKARAEEIGETAASRVQEWGEIARERSRELARRAQEQARKTANEKPVHVALGAGAVGFLAGVALRIRRARHA